jgi:hypothetical protein
MHGDYRVVDADGHVIEPADLWEKYIDPEFRDQAPRCFGAMSVDVLGHRMPDVPGWKEASSSIATRRTGDPRFAFAAERDFDPSSQLEAMDVEGIDMAVLYPSRGLFAASADGSRPARRRHLPRLQPLARRVLQPCAASFVRRGDGLAARRRGRGARGRLRRRGARHEGDLHPAESGERQDHRSPRLRRALFRGRAPERPDRDARRRRCAPQHYGRERYDKLFKAT